MGNLTKVPGHTYLFRRGAVYYYRRVVPDDLRSRIGKSEFLFSLRTKDFEKAKNLVIRKSLEVEREFELARNASQVSCGAALDEITSSQAANIEDVVYASLLDEDDEVRLSEFAESVPSEDSELGHWNATVPEEPLPTFEEYAEDGEQFLEMHKSLLAKSKSNSFLEGELEEYLS